MIYVGIGSLRYSMEQKDLKPIMLHGNQITIANIHDDKVSWRFLTLSAQKVYWLNDPLIWTDDAPALAFKYLEEIKQNMTEESKATT